MTNSAIIKKATFACAILFVGLFAGFSHAGALLTWDWNDGTTQGWLGSSDQSNLGGKFLATNFGNGSLQMFGPVFHRPVVAELATISFDLTITRYSTVTSPAGLTYARLQLNPQLPCPPACPQQQILYWNLDLSNLAFDQTRTFSLSMKNASSINPDAPLPDFARFDLIFADPQFDANTSSGLLDNFNVSAPDIAIDIPALGPSQLVLMAALMLLVAWRFSRR